MIKHIVFFRFPKSDNHDRLLQELKDKLENLNNEIPEIVKLEAGINISPRESAYDLALVSDFRTEEDLEKYRVHPAHQNFIELIKSYDRELAVVDYTY